jgi:hypothetical protein
MGFPVTDERPFLGVRRRWGLGGRRDPSELPPPCPGTVLVFAVHGGYQELPGGVHPRGSEDIVVDAIGVSVVDVRERHVEVNLAIPSSSAAYDFVVRVTFTCKVTRPATVAAMGLTDVTIPLSNHLRADGELMRLGTSRRAEDINQVRRFAIARVTAYCEFHIPRIDGMNITLASVDVIVPPDHRMHATDLVAEERRQKVLELMHAFENRDVDRLVQIIGRGPDAVSALGLSRGEIHTGQVAERAYADAETELNTLIDLLKKLPDGAFDFVSVDAKALFEEVLARVARPRPPSGALEASESVVDKAEVVAGGDAPASANGYQRRMVSSADEAEEAPPPPLDEDDALD